LDFGPDSPVFKKIPVVSNQNSSQPRLTLELIALLLNNLYLEVELLSKIIEGILEHFDEDFGELHLHLF
jgi:hypothetical protein